MRAPDRDRRQYGVAALCLAVILLSAPAGAISAEYTVAPNGTLYHVSLEVEGVDSYLFTEPGVMGEDVRITVQNLSVSGPDGPVEFEKKGSLIFDNEGISEVTFPEGNYTLVYDAPLSGNKLMVIYDKPYNVTVRLPETLDVRNPALGMLSRGGEIRDENGNVSVYWEDVPYFECRFYESFQEQALTIFGTLWIGLVVFFLVPYFLIRRRNE